MEKPNYNKGLYAVGDEKKRRPFFFLLANMSAENVNTSVDDSMLLIIELLLFL